MKLIIDANSLAYRAYYKLPQGMSFKEKDTNVIYGFLQSLRALAEQFETNQIVFCWDSPRSYRRIAYPRYKEGRNKGLDQRQVKNLQIAKKQFDDLREDVLPGMGFRNIFEQNGYEADDLIAWVVNRFPENYVIVSSDEDLLQLLRKERSIDISIWNYKEVITEEKFTRKYGLIPREWARVKAIAGCKTDNVDGIAGVGEATAVKYLNGVLKDGKTKKAIEVGRSIIERNWDLVALPFSGDKMIAVEEVVEDTFYIGEVMEVFRDYGFQSFLGEGQLSRWREVFDIRGGSRKRLKI